MKLINLIFPEKVDSSSLSKDYLGDLVLIKEEYLHEKFNLIEIIHCNFCKCNMSVAKWLK